MQKIRKVMFPVAGLGTRFLPATKAIPKEMLPIVDRPLIQYAADEATDAGASSLVFITNRSKQAISDHFDSAFELETRLREDGKLDVLEKVQGTLPSGVNRAAVSQPEALGLGHAVLCGADAVGNEPFGVILPDDLIVNSGPGCLAQMVQVYEQTGCSVIAVEEVPHEHTNRYGIVSTVPHGDRVEKLEAIVEKPEPAQAPSNLAVVGRYLLTPKIFDLLANTTPGAGGEIQLTDAIAELLAVEDVYCYRFQGTRYDCGSKLGFVQATVELALADPDMGQSTMTMLKTLLNE
ncbi:MAG: UTP--glucose-1-phosphate uridylyltransferase GalU [Lysobacterales bacterium]